MKKSLFQKSLAVLLASLMLAGTFVTVPAFASEDNAPLTTASGTDDQQDGSGAPMDGDMTFGSFRTVSEIKKFLGTIAYKNYDIKYENVPKGKKTISVDVTDYDVENTDAAVEVKTNYVGVDKALTTPSTGKTSWKVTIPETGRYAIRITYYPEPGTYTTIERMVYIDGYFPFSESRYYYFPRVWEYQTLEDGSFEKDKNGNDIRPIREESPEWQTYYLRDWLGYTMAPYEYYFTEGEHLITFEATREPMTISSIELYPYEGEISYSEFLEKMKAEGVTEVTGVEPVKIQAENPEKVSNACLFPTNDRTSSLTEPQDPAVIKFNYLDASVANQWMRYEVEVPKAGLYRIVTRFRQNSLIGMFTSRRLYVNGEIQFAEASHLRFKYSPDWQVLGLNNGTQEFLFYLQEGKNTLTFEVVLGDMEPYIYEIEQMIEELNDAYQMLLQLTGPVPDAYRDYGFNRLVPEAIVTIGNSADALYRIADELKQITGEVGDQVQQLETVATLFEKMARNEYEIAPNFVSFKNYIISLSNWLYAALGQPIKLDYFVVQGVDSKLPQARSNFLQGAWFEIRAFIMSFFMDYTTIGFKGDVVYDEDKTVEMWIANAAAGRDSALIQRGLIDNYFTPESGISVTIKVITAGLTEAILAGIGPDVSNMSSTDTITWGLRNAVEPLNDFEGFDETMTWFSEAATTPLTLYGTTYGLPTSLSFYMLFYRVDVFVDLGLKIPTTWDELYDVIPALQNSSLQMSVPTSALAGLNMFIYQKGGSLYRDNGMRINVDANESLDAFESYCDLFTKYKCPVVEDMSRFRTGEIPIMIADAIGTYNSLMSFYELRGLWEMAPLLGFEDEEGKINRTSPITTSAIVIPRGANNPEATWEYMKWSVCEETQLLQAKETLAVSANPTTKMGTATTGALLKLAWTDYEYEAIKTQLDALVGIPEYPGNYIVGTYVNAAFQDVYAKSSDPSTQMLDRVLNINKEISRKRREFRMDYYDLNSTQNGQWILIEGER
ncbi:MAG: extracellular solute-binding protein [Firmicutes bacterium]|nr:extracellular solute-binding protein [Bacillota bacterium]